MNWVSMKKEVDMAKFKAIFSYLEGLIKTSQDGQSSVPDLENLLNTKLECWPCYHNVWLFRWLFPDNHEWLAITDEAMVIAYITVLSHDLGGLRNFTQNFSWDK